MQLTVNSPPVIEPFSFPKNLQEGGRAQVSCQVSSGDMPVYFNWHKDGVPIPMSLQVRISISGAIKGLLMKLQIDPTDHRKEGRVLHPSRSEGYYVKAQWEIHLFCRKHRGESELHQRAVGQR